MLAMIPPHTLLLGVLLLILFVFFVYRALMRSGKAVKVFDTQERTPTTRKIISDIERGADSLENRETSLESDQQKISNELTQIKKYKNE